MARSVLQVQRITSRFSSASVEKMQFSRAIFLCGYTAHRLGALYNLIVIDSAPFSAAGLITRLAEENHVTV